MTRRGANIPHLPWSPRPDYSISLLGSKQVTMLTLAIENVMQTLGKDPGSDLVRDFFRTEASPWVRLWHHTRVDLAHSLLI